MVTPAEEGTNTGDIIVKRPVEAREGLVKPNKNAAALDVVAETVPAGGTAERAIFR